MDQDVRNAKLVIAAFDFNQAMEAARRERLAPGWTYLRGPDTLRGMTEPRLWCVDGWTENRLLAGKIGEVQAYLAHRGGQTVQAGDLGPWRRREQR